jgi:hypothetical protein
VRQPLLQLPDPLQKWVAHSPAGSWPEGMGWQLPAVPEERWQDSQLPAQALPQHTPSEQNPDWHSPAVPQPLPNGLSWHVPATQLLPGLQSTLLLHPPRHAPCPLQLPAPQSPPGSLPRATGVHSPVLPGRLQASHVPEHARSQQTPSTQNPPLHSEPVLHASPGKRSPTAAVQLPATQLLPGLHWMSLEQPDRQLPLPLHQAPAHSPSGSRFTGTLTQVPAWPLTLQAWHGPAHAVPQHTPSTQLPERHSGPSPHTTPSGLSKTHSPATHSCPGLQPSDEPQLRGQSALPPHT